MRRSSTDKNFQEKLQRGIKVGFEGIESHRDELRRYEAKPNNGEITIFPTWLQLDFHAGKGGSWHFSCS